MTDEQRAALDLNRVSTQRKLSGESKEVLTMCPICTKGVHQNLPVEFIESKTAWRAANGTLIVCCLKCSTKKRGKDNAREKARA